MPAAPHPVDQRALALKVILPGSAEEVDLLRFQRAGSPGRL